MQQEFFFLSQCAFNPTSKMVILGKDIKLLVPGDPVYVGTAFSRLSLATIVVNPSGVIK